jgi:hypothetical protein
MPRWVWFVIAGAILMWASNKIVSYWRAYRSNLQDQLNERADFIVRLGVKLSSSMPVALAISATERETGCRFMVAENRDIARSDYAILLHTLTDRGVSLADAFTLARGISQYQGPYDHADIPEHLHCASRVAIHE